MASDLTTLQNFISSSNFVIWHDTSFSKLKFHREKMEKEKKDFSNVRNVYM